MLSWYFKSSWFSNLLEKEKHDWTRSLKTFNWCLPRAVPSAWLSLNPSRKKTFSTIYLILMKIWDNPMNISVKITQETMTTKKNPRFTYKVFHLGTRCGNLLWYLIGVNLNFFFESWSIQSNVSGVKFLIWLHCASGLGIKKYAFSSENKSCHPNFFFSLLHGFSSILSLV